MNIVRKDIDQNSAVLTVTVDKADYNEKVEKSLNDIRKKANIPGFRPGKIPVSLVRKKYGISVVVEEVNKIISNELYKYIQDNNVNLLGEPLPVLDEGKEYFGSDEKESYEFNFELGLAPEFEVELTNKDKVDYYNIIVSDEMIDNQVKSYTSRYGKYVQEEVVEAKDMVKGELLELTEGKVNESGIKLSDAVLTAAYMKDETQKALFVGAKKDDIIVFNPKQAFENEAELASLLKISKDDVKDITADFSFRIEGITRYYDSEINTELFDKIYGEGVVTTLEEFYAKIRESFQENLQQDTDYKFGTDARIMLVNKYEGLTFPDDFLKRWLLQSNKNLTPESVEEDYPKIIKDLIWQLIENKIAKSGDVKVDNDEVQEYAKKVAKAQFAQYGMVGMGDDILENYAKDMMKKEDTVKGIYERVIENKVFEIVKSKVKLVNKEISVEDFNKMFEN